MIHNVKRGCDLPISGQPEQKIDSKKNPTSVAILGSDYVGMKPTMLVSEGDFVAAGQPLFVCKKTEGVHYTSPLAGKVVAVKRGEKRRFTSVEVQAAAAPAGQADRIEFPVFEDLTKITRHLIYDVLLKSGAWTGLRTRPFGKVADPKRPPHSIFVTAIDTHPLAADPQVVIGERPADFEKGLEVLATLGDYAVHVCTAPDSRVPKPKIAGLKFHEFAGPHPAGLPGTHIHFIDPVGPKKLVWYIHYQDVMAIGKLFRTGHIDGERVVALAGPRVRSPRLIRTVLGVDLDQLTAGELIGENNRIISGSILNGRKRNDQEHFLGRYHTQVAVLEEGNEREFLGWQMPGGDKFSLARIYLGSVLAGKRFDFTTSTGGSKRAMVPNGSYEKVMPLDILPTQLLRALLTKDSDLAQALGALELEEEDLALCTYVCPGKYDYGSALRENLTLIEKEG
jgi:Na+-transporting NADH:ubiquinone oxidoreductase subunit A